MPSTAFHLIALILILGSAQDKPFRDFRGSGAGFLGSGREEPEPEGLISVRIGVLGPAKGQDGLHQRAAIQLALEEANSRGGYRGNKASAAQTLVPAIPYEMVFRADDGPWGVGAQQVVGFAYEDKVWAIIGGLDGHHTHLAELVVAKAWVPVISPGATDSSIDYANVPWVFRAVPSDIRQVAALLDLIGKRGYKHVAVLTEIQREAQTGFLRLQEGFGRRRFSIALHLDYSPQNPAEVIPRLKGTEIDALLLWGRSDSAFQLIAGLRKAGIAVPILGPSNLALAEIPGIGQDLGELIVASACDLSRIDSTLNEFKRRFRERTGQHASPVALYSYDVARLIVSAIEKSGLNRARIRDFLSESVFEGLTGIIRFDSLGGNPAAPVMMILQRNRWVRLD